MSVFLPTPESVANLFTSLLGREVEVSLNRRLISEVAIAASYSDDSVKRVAVCLLDMNLGASLGAALSLVPKAVADNAGDAVELPEGILENLHEVLNISAQFFYNEDTERISLENIYPPPDEFPLDIIPLIDQKENRVDMRVDIQGYRSGNIAFLALDGIHSE